MSKEKRSPIIYLSRRVVLSASHVLRSEELSDEENKTVFGKCSNPHSHGHNYVIEVTLRGEVDSHGILFNLTDLKKILDTEIMSRMDHKNLNQEVSEFKHRNPTAENIAIVCFEWLEKKLPDGLLYEVRVHETENNVAFYRGE